MEDSTFVHTIMTKRNFPHSYLRIVMRVIFRVKRRRVENMTMVRMRCIEAHDPGVELVNLLVSSDTESQMMQARVALVMRSRVAWRDKNHYYDIKKRHEIELGVGKF